MVSSSSLDTLLRNTSSDDHKSILDAAGTSLKANSNDDIAGHARLVALLKLDRFADAARVVERQNEKQRQAHALECSYALYKAERLGEADKILQQHGKKSQSLLHMEAQVAYRREDFARAQQIYKALLSQTSVDADEESELRINRRAVDAQLIWAGLGHMADRVQAERQDLGHFETVFNAACGYIAQGNIKEAEFLLRRAVDLCMAAEELSEEDKRAEIAPIKAQLVCVLCWQGKLREAQQVASSAKVQDNLDTANRQLARVNKLAASTSQPNPFVAQRALSAENASTFGPQLFTFQRTLLARDERAVDLQSQKSSAVGKDGVDDVYAGVYAAAVQARAQAEETALKSILPLLDRRPNDVGLLMTIVQLYALTSNAQTASALLEKFLGRLERSTKAEDLDARFSPGLVGLTVSLYSGQHRLSAARTELLKAARHWRRKTKWTNSALSVLRASAAALLETPSNENLQAARELFELLSEADTGDKSITAGLAATKESNSQGPTEDATALQPIDELVAGLNVEELEAKGVATLYKPSAAPTAGRGSVNTTAQAKHSKRMRKSRLPKNYDPQKAPDPERWLPLRDRSSYKSKSKKKNKASPGASTQGVVAPDEAPSKPEQPGQQAASKKKKNKGKGGK